MDYLDLELDESQMLRLRLVEIAGPSLVYVSEIPMATQSASIGRLAEIEKYILEGYSE